MPRPSARPSHADVADKAPNWRHSTYAAWIEQATGHEVDVKTIQLSMSLYNDYRGSDMYAAAVAEQAANAEAERQMIAARKLQATKDRIAKAEADLERLKSLVPDDDTEPEAPAKVPAKKAPAKAVKSAPVAPPAKSAPRGAAKKAAANKAVAGGGATVTSIDKPTRGRAAAKAAAASQVTEPSEPVDPDIF